MPRYKGVVELEVRESYDLIPTLDGFETEDDAIEKVKEIWNRGFSHRGVFEKMHAEVFDWQFSVREVEDDAD